MIRPGLVSVTFRRLAPDEIIALAKQAGLRGIEWGGDVHVPQGDLRLAREVRRLTEDAGLEVAAYGSYYCLGKDETKVSPSRENLPFARVAETACELGAPAVRVWAGAVGSSDATPDDWKRVVDDAHCIAATAASLDLLVAYEYHGGTLTDTPAAARRLLHETVHTHIRTLWQPPAEMNPVDRPAALREVLPHLLNLHVYHWESQPGQGTRRCPLHEGEAQWRHYLEVAASTGRGHWALLEFVRDDAPEALVEDAHTLCRWLRAPHD